jgi:hypothetical protein
MKNLKQIVVGATLVSRDGLTLTVERRTEKMAFTNEGRKKVCEDVYGEYVTYCNRDYRPVSEVSEKPVHGARYFAVMDRHGLRSENMFSPRDFLDQMSPEKNSATLVVRSESPSEMDMADQFDWEMARLGDNRRALRLSVSQTDKLVSFYSEKGNGVYSGEVVSESELAEFLQSLFCETVTNSRSNDDNLAYISSLVKKHTAFSSFDKLINARGGYVPSLNVSHPEIAIIADEYDTLMQKEGDDRRAYRYEQVTSSVLEYLIKQEIVNNGGVNVCCFDDKQRYQHVCVDFNVGTNTPCVTVHACRHGEGYMPPHREYWYCIGVCIDEVGIVYEDEETAGDDIPTEDEQCENFWWAWIEDLIPRIAEDILKKEQENA